MVYGPEVKYPCPRCGGAGRETTEPFPAVAGKCIDCKGEGFLIGIIHVFEICERCQARVYRSAINEWLIQVGEIDRKPHWCDRCTREVQAVILDIMEKEVVT